MQALRDAVDQRIADRARQNGDRIPQEDLKRAFQKILDRLNDGQRAMLKAHYHAPDQAITATELSQAVGYSSWSPANLHYGNIGAMLYDEAPIVLDKRSDGTPVYTSYLATDFGNNREEGHWKWKLRPEIAFVIEHFGLHV